MHTKPAPYADRREAGRVLAEKLADKYGNDADVLVLALPRGGVPVAFEVATTLQAPLDLFVVRKLGVPGHEEYAMGAIASGGTRVLSEEVIRTLHISEADIARVAAEEQRELERRERAYRGERPAPDVKGRTVLLVDDGLATGSTMLAAVRALRTLEPARIVVAVPVAPPETCDTLRREADEVVSVISPDPFYAVGLWYREFPQTSDAEVTGLLAEASREAVAIGRPPRARPSSDVRRNDSWQP